MKIIWKILSDEDVQHMVIAIMTMIALAYVIIHFCNAPPDVIP